MKREQLKKIRCQAVEMDQEGKTADEIADALGRPTSTVRRWLSEDRGRKDFKRTRVAAAMRDAREGGRPIEAAEIAMRTGVKETYVRNILSAMKTNKRGRRTAEAIAIDILKGPTVRQLAVSDSVGMALVKQCIKQADDHPRSAEAQVQVAKVTTILRGLRRTREHKPARQFVNCLLLQVFATRAVLIRQQPDEAGLENLVRGEQTALRVLNGAEQIYSCGCHFCHADVYRRRAWIQLHLGSLGLTDQFEAAKLSIDAAKNIYSETNSDGHDYWGNARGSCALVEAWIYLYQAHSGIEVEENACRGREIAGQTLDTTKGGLLDRLTYAYAVGLFKEDTPEGRDSAEEKITAVLLRCPEESSIGRSRLEWLKGELLRARGEGAKARSNFENAVDYAREVESLSGVLASISSLATCAPASALVATLDDLKDYSDTLCQKILPEWLKPARSAITEAKKAVWHDPIEASKLLWRGGQGDKFMPRPSHLIAI